jgi:hypothetical protein
MEGSGGFYSASKDFKALGAFSCNFFSALSRLIGRQVGHTGGARAFEMDGAY